MMSAYPSIDPYNRPIHNSRVHYVIDGHTCEGRLVRLTFEGVLIDAPMPPAVGSAISVVLTRDDGTVAPTLAATVSWSRASGFAARWTALEPRHVRALDSFVLALSRAALGLNERDEEPLS